MKKAHQLVGVAGIVAALVLSACGGGSTGSTGTGTGTSTGSGAGAGSVSSGTVTAFGSVFVNGHEFDTDRARVIDDDTGTTSSGTAALEVGMSVDVLAAGDSSDAKPVASEVRLHPLARGVVDASDAAGSAITVMGQTVQLTASTNFSDHRACLTAATNPCAEIAGQSGLVATTGTGAAAVAGHYVTVHGFLFAAAPAPAAAASGAAADSGAAHIVATLVSISDAPVAATRAAYKVEGMVTAAGANSVTIGGLTVDLAAATCQAHASAPAASAASAPASAPVVASCNFSAGQVVSAFGSAAPALPATTFAATSARVNKKLAVETPGASVELEGKVLSVTTAPAGFVLRGVAVDATAAGVTLPMVGDLVRVLGTVAANGTSITATSVKVLHAALSATFGFEGNVDSVAAGATAETYVLGLLGQSISVDATTRLADRSTRDGGRGSATTKAFNITTFQTYLAASASQHVLVRTKADAAGKLTALSLTLVPASTAAAVTGPVDATPAPVNGTAAATPTTFAIHGVAVSADPAAITSRRDRRGKEADAATTIAARDFVLARGTFAAGTLTVTAPSSSKGPGAAAMAAANIVIDFGVPGNGDRDCF